MDASPEARRPGHASKGLDTCDCDACPDDMLDWYSVQEYAPRDIARRRNKCGSCSRAFILHAWRLQAVRRPEDRSEDLGFVLNLKRRSRTADCTTTIYFPRTLCYGSETRRNRLAHESSRVQLGCIQVSRAVCLATSRQGQLNVAHSICNRRRLTAKRLRAIRSGV